MALIEDWLAELSRSSDEQKQARPRYWADSPEQLVSSCHAGSFATGTGAALFASHILPEIETAERELIFVTCFWAPSPSLQGLNASLRTLSRRAEGRNSRISVRICLSSLSFWRKLLHTRAPAGQEYPPSSWAGALGLPRADELPGLDMAVKSVFLLPFSVMHPKFVILDRRTVLLPSCNVSWEAWLEGSVRLTGGIVGQFVNFYEHFWQQQSLCDPSPSASQAEAGLDGMVDCSTALFLPSPHHVHPRFRVWPWQGSGAPPATPLNCFLLAAFRHARRSIYIQTPNLTAAAVRLAILQALADGVDVQIVTSERLMVLEQLLTAGTTTARCIADLVRRHEALLGRSLTTGRLGIRYFRPRARPEWAGGDAEPVQSHLKATVVDAELVVLGSGNMDRASWYTSQEVGVALFSPALAQTVRAAAERSLVGRCEWRYCRAGPEAELYVV